MTARQIGMLASLAAIWGASYLLIKIVLRDLEPGTLVFARVALAAVVLITILAVRERGRLLRAVISDVRNRPGWALLLGLTAVAGPFTLITFGELVVPSGLTAVLISPSSLFVAALAPFIDPSEGIHRRQLVGMLVGLAGVVLLVGVESIGSFEAFLGALAMLGASAGYGVSGFIVRGRYGHLPPVATSTISLTASTLLTLPLGVATAPDHLPHVGPLLALVALAAVGTALAFLLFYGLIGELGAGRASLVSYLTPGVALVYGALFLDEAISFAAIGGLVLILGGVAWAARRPPAPEGAVEAA